METSYQSIPARLRAQCDSLRRKPTPLADLIPLLQQAADQHDKLAAALEGMLAAHPYANDGRDGYGVWVTTGQVEACRKARAALGSQSEARS